MEGPLTLNEFIDVLLITVSIIVVVPLTIKLPIILTLFNVDWPGICNIRGLGQRPKWSQKYLENETKSLVNSRKDFYGILEIPHHKNNLSSRQDCYEIFEISHQKNKLGHSYIRNPHFISRNDFYQILKISQQKIN